MGAMRLFLVISAAVEFPDKIEPEDLYAYASLTYLSGGVITAWDKPPHEGGNPCTSLSYAQTLIIGDQEDRLVWYGRYGDGWIRREERPGKFSDNDYLMYVVVPDFFREGRANEAMVG